MTAFDLYNATYPIATVAYDRRLRYRLYRRSYQAYIVETDRRGGLVVKLLKTKHGKPVRSQHGVGDLIKQIEHLATMGRLPGTKRTFTLREVTNYLRGLKADGLTWFKMNARQRRRHQRMLKLHAAWVHQHGRYPVRGGWIRDRLPGHFGANQ